MGNCLICSEKLSIWCTCTTMVWCVVLTLLTVLMLGIGLGYNHCFVDMKTRYKYVPAHYAYEGNPRFEYKENDRAFNIMDKSIRKLGDDYQEDSDDLQKEPNVHLSLAETNVQKNFQNLNDLNTNNSMPKLIRKDNLTSDIINTTNSHRKDTISLASIVKSEEESPNTDRKLVIPVTGLDIIELLSKLKANNMSYTINIVTT